ncbi:MAG: hypothetical protein ABSD71_08695 [Bacteroidales bacterium]
MKTVFLLTFILLMPFLIFSQETKKKADSTANNRIYINVSGGPSFPMIYYARIDTKNTTSGFAAQGYVAQVNLDWMGKKNTGFAIQYTLQNNPINHSVKNDTLEGMSKSLGAGSWTNNYLMAGLVYMDFIKKVYIEGRVLFGIMLSSSPLFNTVDPVYQTQSSNTGVGTAYGAQFGVGYQISNRVTVKGNVEFTIGNPSIHRQYSAGVIGVDSITGKFIYSAPIDIDTKKTIYSFNAKAGLVIKLSK